MRFLTAIVPSAIAAAIFCAIPAHAQLVLSEVIVDLGADKPPREDIEAWNNGSERLYIVAQPAEIVGAGTPSEHRVEVPDPMIGGLLVTPQRVILEPGERRLIRVALLAARADRDRVYRVTIKPVVGELNAKTTAIKVLVGYDVLVIARPATAKVVVTGDRHDRTLILSNTGNTSVEIFDGRQCRSAGKNCAVLPATRLYAGARWTQTLPADGPVTYHVKMSNQETIQSF